MGVGGSLGAHWNELQNTMLVLLNYFRHLKCLPKFPYPNQFINSHFSYQLYTHRNNKILINEAIQAMKGIIKSITGHKIRETAYCAPTAK